MKGCVHAKLSMDTPQLILIVKGQSAGSPPVLSLSQGQTQL